MQSQWFVIHTLAGQELNVKDSSKASQTEEMGELSKRSWYPMEKWPKCGMEKERDHPQAASRYVYIDMILVDENQRVLERPWYSSAIPRASSACRREARCPSARKEIEVIKVQIRRVRRHRRPKVSFEVAKP